VSSESFFLRRAAIYRRWRQPPAVRRAALPTQQCQCTGLRRWNCRAKDS
jgi:hypothetical protein